MLDEDVEPAELDDEAESDEFTYFDDEQDDAFTEDSEREYHSKLA